jgi:hypothetical protein
VSKIVHKPLAWPHCDISSLIGFTTIKKRGIELIVKIGQGKQEGQREEREHPIEEKDEDEESSAHSLCVYAIRSQITRDYYLRCYSSLKLSSRFSC